MEKQVILGIPRQFACQLGILAPKKPKPRSRIAEDAIRTYFQPEAAPTKDDPFDPVRGLMGSVSGGPPTEGLARGDTEEGYEDYGF